MSSSGAADLIRIGDLEIEVAVSARRRSVRLTIERDARVVATVPPDIDREKLAAMLRARTDWIYGKLGARETAAAARPLKEFVTGEGFLYLGRSYRLKVIPDSSAPVALIQGRLLLGCDRLEHAEDDLISWYRARGQAWLPKRAQPWAERMRAPVNEITVRRLGYRWGSCSSKGGVNIHWATMQLPVGLIDYILVHELAHLRQSGHSAAFWQVVGRAMPDFASRRTQLEKYGAQLWLPGAQHSP